MSAARAAIALACACVAIAGCGDSRTPVPSLTRPASPDGFRALSFATAGVSFLAPRDWTVLRQRAPLVAVVTSGDAVIALWRYPRARALPVTGAQLAAARAALIAAARARPGSLRVIRSSVVRVGKAGAIELDATERIAGQLRRVLSTHVFADRAEIVLEEYAPRDLFRGLDRSVFSPLRHSLSVVRPA